MADKRNSINTRFTLAALPAAVSVVLAAGSLVYIADVKADGFSPGYSLSAGGSDAGSLNQPHAYRFNQQDLTGLQFSRTATQSSQTESPTADILGERQTEVTFKLSPGKFQFNRAGAFGLGGVFSNPVLAIQNHEWGVGVVPELHNGLSYSAGVVLEEDTEFPGTAYVSSSQLGISYGRMGSLWYSGVDLTVGFAADTGDQSGAGQVQMGSEVLSVDFTTGRKLDVTGMGKSSPLWLLSLQGNFDVQSVADSAEGIGDVEGDWYLNPSLFWDNPGFTFSAQLQLPVDRELLENFEPDYRLRAVFEKRFK